MSGVDVAVRTKRFPDPDGKGMREILGGLRFAAGEGEFLAILGPSGCGKTTLLNLIAGLDPAYEGSVRFSTASGRASPVIGYVFQSPRLLPWRTARENVALALERPEAKADLIDSLLESAGLTAFQDAYPEKLSLGQCRRAAIVRAFAVEPDLLLMDEPFVSLDAPTAGRLRRLLLEIWGARPTAVLFVTHDTDEAIALADRVLVLSGSPAAVLADVAITAPRSERADPAVLATFRNLLLEARNAGSEGGERA